MQGYVSVEKEASIPAGPVLWGNQNWPLWAVEYSGTMYR